MKYRIKVTCWWDTYLWEEGKTGDRGIVDLDPKQQPPPEYFEPLESPPEEEAPKAEPKPATKAKSSKAKT